MEYRANWKIIGLGRDVERGDIIEMDAAKAAELVRSGALTHVAGAATAPPSDNQPPDLSKMTNPQLIAYAKDALGITLPARSTRTQIMEAITPSANPASINTAPPPPDDQPPDVGDIIE